ncbi:MAG: hypothetical protein BKPUNTRY_001683, partial [Candidatus Fervidibacter sp.]
QKEAVTGFKRMEVTSDGDVASRLLLMPMLLVRLLVWL